MIKCVSYWAFPGGLEGKVDPVEAMEKAKALGFSGIELAVGLAGYLTIDSPRSYCEELKAASARIGTKIASVACGLGWSRNLADPDPARRKLAVQTHARALQVTQWLGVDAMLVVPGYVYIPWEPNTPPVPYETAYKLARQSMRQLARRAEKLRVHACPEMVWNGLMYSPLEFRRFLEEVGSRYVGMYFDCGNMMAFGYPEHWIAVLGRRIRRVHLKDYKRDPGGIAGFCDLLQGEVNYKAVMAGLRKARYTGPLTLETFNRTDDDLRKESKALDRILRM